MNRRKFIIGAGSLATGSAAIIGSGAFSTAEADRSVNVEVAADESGFVEITALNDTYASGTSDGQLELDFNDDSGVGVFDGDAQGVNPGATFNFPEIFQIANVSGLGDARVVIEATGFEDLESLELTADGDEALDIDGGTSLRVKDYDDVDNLPKLNQPDAVKVDIEMETKPADEFTGEIGGELTIHFATGGNRDELSGVL